MAPSNLKVSARRTFTGWYCFVVTGEHDGKEYREATSRLTWPTKAQAVREGKRHFGLP